MNPAQVAAALDEIAVLLELKGENPFRARAYSNGARVIGQLDVDFAQLIAEDKLGTIPGIGEALQEKITTLVTTGKLPFLEELRAQFPEGLQQMLRIPGLGPKKVKTLYDLLKIDSVDKLRSACSAGDVAALKGFGQKTQAKILEGLAFLEQGADRVRIDQALPTATQMLEQVRACPGVIRSELCGSIRRRKETIADIDILVSSDKPLPIMDRFVKLPGVAQVVAQGETKSTVKVNAVGAPRVLINCDLRVVTDKQFPFALHYFTGSKDHNIVIRGRAQQMGLKLNEYELAGNGKSVTCKDEAALFKALGLDCIPPELREHTGEIDAALNHHLPDLIKVEDIQGVFHCHTDWSDGRSTLTEMVEASRKLGFKYFGIGDHSQSLKLANGLTPERVKQQHAEIDALNAKTKGMRILKGTECDILPDGRLDFSDDVLDSFDYVVASVHTNFNQTEEEMTARIIRAVSHPKVTILGHATGRLLLRRDAYHVNLEAVLKAAAEHDTLVEINAHPQRLDIDWVHCKRAKALGVKLVINPDAHSTDEIALYRFGVDVARRGWLEKKDVFNTQSLAEVTKALEL
jgi:DNA polymerase (family 10)